VGLYYEDVSQAQKATSKLVKVDSKETLGQILRDPRYLVIGGTPGFIILPENSHFAQEFKGQYV